MCMPGAEGSRIRSCYLKVRVGFRILELDLVAFRGKPGGKWILLGMGEMRCLSFVDIFDGEFSKRIYRFVVLDFFRSLTNVRLLD